LQLIDTVFTEIDEKIIHTFSRVWDILSEYGEDQTFTAYFVRETASGLPAVRLSKLSNTVFNSRSTNFDSVPELEGSRIEFKNLRGDSSNIEEFTRAVASIVYYMVKYDSLVMIKESHHNDNVAGYALIASLTEILDESYLLTTKTSPTESMKAKLSDFARSRLSYWRDGYYDGEGMWHDGWNKDYSSQFSGFRYWTDGNIYPLYMFKDANLLNDRIARLLGVSFPAGDLRCGIFKLVS
ncbi:MAG: hypothetical protein ACFFCI_19450, partial [Promethearchaeota archaeon]